jgi:hypothetical protein
VGFWESLVCPSSKLHRYVYGGVPPLAAAENETDSGAAPVVDVVADAVTANVEKV